MRSTPPRLMMIDMNGPDIEAVSEDANSGICQSVEELQGEGVVKGQSRGPKSPRDEECLLSTLGT